MSRLPLRSLALIAVDALLIVAIAWRLTQDAADAPAAASDAASLELAKFAAAATPTTVDLAVLTERPLFHSRRLFVALPDPNVAAARPAPPQYQFAGAMLLPGRPAAGYLKHSQSGQSLKVSLGDLVDGWTVSAIESRGVILEHSGERITIGSSATAATPGITPVSLSARSATPAANPGIRVLGAPGSAPAPAGAAPFPPPNTSGRKPRTYQPPPTS